MHLTWKRPKTLPNPAIAAEQNIPDPDAFTAAPTLANQAIDEIAFQLQVMTLNGNDAMQDIGQYVIVSSLTALLEDEDYQDDGWSLVDRDAETGDSTTQDNS
ncbi:hypothetical protein BGZ51_002570 [Haplosporangium sp. Z 767]|nr:hypothetical protein BGZ50_003977 [Haplosporangium sp. Z 11]KAF9193623.1 hypothetical protein BGZ51_002570 [Haplosporangium sp. Z 767]